MNRAGRRRADVLGAGPVGLTCAKLLAESGWSVRVLITGPQVGRAIAVSARTARILADLWGRDPAKICSVHALTHRRVAWAAGGGAEDVDVPAVSLDTADLGRGLQSLLRGAVEFVPGDSGDAAPMAPVLDARGAPPPERCALTAGQRRMYVWRDVPVEAGFEGRCEILAGPGFWAFLLPTGPDRISVQIATPGAAADPEEVAQLLAEAAPGTLARALGHAPGLLGKAPFATASIAPRLGLLPVDPATIPVGDRAIAYDPICGDGTGQGLRSALLAVAALKALDGGEPAGPILDHVRSRYLFAFRSHLDQSLRYYRSIPAKQLWQDDILAAETALRALHTLAPASERPMRLHYAAVGQNPGPMLKAANESDILAIGHEFSPDIRANRGE